MLVPEIIRVTVIPLPGSAQTPVSAGITFQPEYGALLRVKRRGGCINSTEMCKRLRFAKIMHWSQQCFIVCLVFRVDRHQLRRYQFRGHLPMRYSNKAVLTTTDIEVLLSSHRYIFEGHDSILGEWWYTLDLLSTFSWWLGVEGQLVEGKKMYFLSVPSSGEYT